MTHVHTCVVCNNSFARLGLNTALERAGARNAHFFSRVDQHFYSHVRGNPHLRYVILALFDGAGGGVNTRIVSDALTALLPDITITVLSEEPGRQRHIVYIPRKIGMPGLVKAFAMKPAPRRKVLPVPSALSQKEAQVLTLWYAGVSLSGIARITGRSVKTISAHKRSAMRKLTVSCNQALLYTLQGMEHVLPVQEVSGGGSGILSEIPDGIGYPLFRLLS